MGEAKRHNEMEIFAKRIARLQVRKVGATPKQVRVINKKIANYTVCYNVLRNRMDNNIPTKGIEIE
jgi:hypothetical protein